MDIWAFFSLSLSVGVVLGVIKNQVHIVADNNPTEMFIIFVLPKIYCLSQSLLLEHLAFASQLQLMSICCTIRFVPSYHCFSRQLVHFSFTMFHGVFGCLVTRDFLLGSTDGALLECSSSKSSVNSRLTCLNGFKCIKEQKYDNVHKNLKQDLTSLCHLLSTLKFKYTGFRATHASIQISSHLYF